MKIAVRDNHKQVSGTIADPTEFRELLITRLKGVVNGLTAKNIDKVRSYCELYTIIETLRDQDKIGSMEISHAKLKLDNLEGTFIMRRYKEEEPRMATLCSKEGCEQVAVCEGFCGAHCNCKA